MPFRASCTEVFAGMVSALYKKQLIDLLKVESVKMPHAPTWFTPTFTGLFVSESKPVVAGKVTVIVLPAASDKPPDPDVLKPIA
jgi:hypothetical protein